MTKLREDLLLYGKWMLNATGYLGGQVEVTSRCYQRCAYCSSWRDPAHLGSWSFYQMVELFEDLATTPAFEHLTWTGGDPQAWEEFERTLLWVAEFPCRFALQITTPLSLPVSNPALWRQAFRDVRVSIDAATVDGYKRTRGVKLDPLQILQNLEQLAHPRVATFTVVSPENLEEIPRLLELLEPLPLRRRIFVPVWGVDLPAAYWEAYHTLRQRYAGREGTNFGEGMAFNPEHKCWAGTAGFHLKSNGDVYPCPLVGGEAVATCPEFKLGNYFARPHLEPFRQLFMRRFASAESVASCVDICQYKQCQLNAIGQLASATCLALP